MNNKLVIRTDNLPVKVGGEVNRVVGAVLRGLDSLGFVYVTRDQVERRVRLSTVRLYADKWLALEVDVGRLPPRVNVVKLLDEQVAVHLSAVCGYPVRAVGRALSGRHGLTYAVALSGDVERRRVTLPARADLDLETRPAGGLVPVGVGAGGPVWAKLGRLGHSLVVGATGSGKSTWLHVALAGLLLANGPERLRVVLIDPKRCELALWAGAPHLWARMAHDTGEASALLSRLADEVGRRGGLFAAAGVRDLAGYNRQAAVLLPTILVVIDEGLDLVLDAGARSELVGALKSLAMKGRGVGVFVWLATQHAAAAGGLPRVVSVNMATRLAFRVLDRSAAEVAGCPGAEKLSRPGRMLARIGGGEAEEVQGYYLDDEALSDVAGAVAEAVPAGGNGAVLTEAEQALVRYALEKLDGEFIVNRLGKAVEGWSPWRVMKLARKWEDAGWLSEPAHATDARRVLPSLAGMIA